MPCMAKKTLLIIQKSYLSILFVKSLKELNLTFMFPSLSKCKYVGKDQIPISAVILFNESISLKFCQE